MAEAEIMLRSEHKRILSAAQERYDYEVTHSRTSDRVLGGAVGFAIGAVFGAVVIAAALYAIITA